MVFALSALYIKHDNALAYLYNQQTPNFCFGLSRTESDEYIYVHHIYPSILSIIRITHLYISHFERRLYTFFFFFLSAVFPVTLLLLCIHYYW